MARNEKIHRFFLPRIFKDGLGQACQTQTHVRAALSYSKTKKLSVGHSFEKFFKFYCSKARLYDNLSKN
jgi:hypothetical protein